MSGWIKLHKAIKDHWIFENPEYLKAWLQILIEVNYEPKTSIIQGQQIFCDRGQKIYSMESWAKIFGKKWTRKRARCFFELLKKDGMIRTEGLSKTTRVTVCNYETYQNQGPTEGQHSGQHSDQIGANTRATIKEIKNKEYKKKEYIDEIPPFIPLEAFKDFQEFRRQIKKPLTQISAKKIFNFLETQPLEDIEEILAQSIRNNWQGVFPLKKGSTNGSKSFAQQESDEFEKIFNSTRAFRNEYYNNQ